MCITHRLYEMQIFIIAHAICTLLVQLLTEAPAICILVYVGCTIIYSHLSF